MTYAFSVVFHSRTVQRMGIIRTVIRTGRAKHMAKAHLKLVTPTIVKRTVTPKRPPNADLRTREHLTEAEVERLMDASRKNRWGHRDATMVLVAYRHGFRAAELVEGIRSISLRERCTFAGSSGAHRVLTRSWAMNCEPCGAFCASSTQVTLRVHVGARSPFQHRWLRPHGRARWSGGKLGFKVHPHMLRHACG